MDRRSLLLAAPALLIAGTARAADSPAPRPLAQKATVKVGISSRLEAFAPVLVGAALGEYARENIGIEYVIARPNDGLVLLSTGRIDVLASQPSAAFFNAIAGGNDVRYVAPGVFQPPQTPSGVWVRKEFLAGKPFRPAMMKGQTIASAIGPGATASVLVQQELEKDGLNINDVNFRTMGSADILVALENGAVNFGFLTDPIWQNADTTKLQFLFGYGMAWSGGSWEYGPTLLRSHRDVGEAFMRAFLRTIRLWLQPGYHKNPKVLPVLAKEVDLPEDKLRDSLEPFFAPDLPIPGDLTALLQRTYMLTPGLLTYTTPLPEAQVVDRAFLDGALKG